MAKRKQKTELETTSVEQQNNDQQYNEQQNNEVIEVIEDNKNETTNEKTKEKQNTNKENYIITKKSEGVYIRKLRRL